MIEAEVKLTFASKKSKNLERGIAFPTCISVNHIMGHYSPLLDESTLLVEGDVAKIICGAHFDGYAANAATTVVVGDTPCTGKKADVILAAWHAFQAAQRVIAEASTNHEVTDVIQRIAEQFECNAVEGVLSHKIKRHIIDGNDCIINKASATDNVSEFQFTAGDVIGLDIFVSTGEGKPREDDSRCTVFKRELEQVYNLKMKSARAFFVEVNKRFPTLPFSLRAMTDQVAAKVGVRECTNHDLLVPYPVLTERAGEYVAHFKATIVVQPRSTAVICGNTPIDLTKITSEHSITDEEMLALLAKDLWKKPKKNAAATAAATTTQ